MRCHNVGFPVVSVEVTGGVVAFRKALLHVLLHCLLYWCIRMPPLEVFWVLVGLGCLVFFFGGGKLTMASL